MAHFPMDSHKKRCGTYYIYASKVILYNSSANIPLNHVYMLTKVILLEFYRTSKLNISSFRCNFFLPESVKKQARYEPISSLQLEQSWSFGTVQLWFRRHSSVQANSWRILMKKIANKLSVWVYYLSYSIYPRVIFEITTSQLTEEELVQNSREIILHE